MGSTPHRGPQRVHGQMQRRHLCALRHYEGHAVSPPDAERGEEVGIPFGQPASVPSRTRLSGDRQHAPRRERCVAGPSHGLTTETHRKPRWQAEVSIV